MSTIYLIRSIQSQWDKFYNDNFPGVTTVFLSHEQYTERMLLFGIVIGQTEGGFFYIVFTEPKYETMFFLKYG